MSGNNDPEVSAGSPKPLLTRLSLMMFLQYFVQGSYLPIASVYVQDALGFTAMQVGIFGAALAVGPIVAPFIATDSAEIRLSRRLDVLVHRFEGGSAPFETSDLLTQPFERLNARLRPDAMTNETFTTVT